VNFRAFFVAFAFAGNGAPALANNTLFAATFDPVWVLGYHVGYEADMYPTDKIDFAAMSHVVIGPVTPNTDGTLDTTFDIDPANGPLWAMAVAQAAHAASRHALLMIGGAGSIDGWRGAAGNANRATFVANLIAEMDAIGADGLDLDWEPLETGDQANFIALAQALRGQRPAMLLTVPVNWINANFAAPDPFYGSIAPLFDRIDAMTYEMDYDKFGWNSWFTSALHDETGATPSSIDVTVDFYLGSGVPRSKLGLGVGFYGVCWQGVTGPRQTIGAGAGVVGSDNTYSYHNIVNAYYSAANHHYDAAAQQPYLASALAFGPAPSCNYLSYEDASSIAAKGAYARANGLAGTIIWNIGEGYVPEAVGQENALLDAVQAAFKPDNP